MPLADDGRYEVERVPGSTSTPLWDYYRPDLGVTAGWTAKYQAKRATDAAVDLEATGVITRIDPTTLDADILAGLSKALRTAAHIWWVLFAAPPAEDTQDLVGTYKFGVGLYGPNGENEPDMPSGIIRFGEDIERVVT